MKALLIFSIFLLFSFSAYAEEKSQNQDWQKILESIHQKNNLNYNRLLEKKARGEILGIEAVVASRGAAVMSRWGHTLFRFVDNDKDWGNDIVISFVAETDGPKTSMMKGIFGGYPLVVQFETFSDYWSQYLRNEKRPFERYIIPTNNKIRHELISNLAKWKNIANYAGGYGFFTNNCTVALVRFLSEVEELTRYTTRFTGDRDESGPFEEIVKKDGVIKPVSLGEYLFESRLSPYPTVMVLGMGSLFEKARLILGLNEVNSLFSRDWPTNAAELIRENFSDKEIKQLMHELPLMPIHVRKNLVRDYHFRNGKTSYEEMMGVQRIDSAFYEICTNEVCAENVHEKALQTFGESVWRNHSKKIKKILPGFTITYRNIEGGWLEFNSVSDDLYEEHYHFVFNTGF